MNENSENGSMVLKMSNSGMGARMFTPNGKKIVYCNLRLLKDFCNGKTDHVTFTIARLTQSFQMDFNTLEEPDVQE